MSPLRKLVVSFLAASVLVSARLIAAGQPPAAPDRPNIILIVLDTVRADAVGGRHRQGRSNTPFLDSWARDGLVFARAQSPADFTPASHFSILTGLPRAAYGSTLDTRKASVANQLNDAGYETMGISANPAIDPALMRSIEPFQTWVHSPYVTATALSAETWETAQRHDLEPATGGADGAPEPTLAKLLSSASVINKRLADLLSSCHPAGNFARPVFLLINFLDAHDPYFPPRSAGPSDSAVARHWPLTGDLRRGRPETRPEPAVSGEAPNRENVPRWRRAGDLSARQIAFLRSLYDGEIRALDRNLEETMRILGRAGLLRNAIVVVTSDHGEAFGEQGFLAHCLEEHGFHLPVLYHVPLVIRGYGSALTRGRGANEAFSTAALADSIRSWAGLASEGPDVDPIAVVASPRRPIAGNSPTGPSARLPNAETGSGKARETTTKQESDQELVRRLRSLGYLK